MSSQELIIPQESQALILRSPDQVLSDAKRAAEALMNIIASKPKEDKLIMNGELYLSHEDWGTVSRFYGTVPKLREDRFCQYGDAFGFEATVDLVEATTGRVISSATAMCLNDETNWGDRTKYKFEDVLGKDGKKIWDENKKRYKSKRVEDGTVPTPLFQLRSMATTRASAKVQRLVYSWVLVLAGVRISPTPAEEMGYGEVTETEKREPVQQPKKAEGQSALVITDGQRKRLFAIGYAVGKKLKLDSEEASARILAICKSIGFDDPANITRDKYDGIIGMVEDADWKPSQAAPVASTQASTAEKPFTVEGIPTGAEKGTKNGPFVRVDMVGIQLFTRDQEKFDVLLASPGKQCVFKATKLKGSEYGARIHFVLQIGDQEWDEQSGLPVIRNGSKAASGMEMDF